MHASSDRDLRLQPLGYMPKVAESHSMKRILDMVTRTSDYLCLDSEVQYSA